MSFFEVDKDGLAKIAERRGKVFVVHELLQNAWDTDATEVRVSFEPVAGRPRARLVVEDDHPDGFKNLTHAFTLFADSEKKADASKRGRFNFGEKLVLALCHEAEIISTTGGVRFDKDGRHMLRRKRDKGSRFEAELRMTMAEYWQAIEALKLLLPPTTIRTIINENLIESRSMTMWTDVTLPTELADDEGYIRRSKRKTKLHIYEPREGEAGHLFEMGIPIMETGDRWHVDVQQKVPLNMERDGVSPAYLREVRAATLNVLHAQLNSPEEAAAPWVRDAMTSDTVEGTAVKQVMETRFGPQRVTFDPSDREANNIAMSRGMTVIPGAALSKEEWKNVRLHEAALPAGQVTPSPKPFHPDGDELKMMDPLTPKAAAVVAYYQRLAPELIGIGIKVRVADDPEWPFSGAFRSGGVPQLIINYAAMKNAIDLWDLKELNRFFIHEMAHNFESNHLAEAFHDACCRLGAKLTHAALTKPQLFNVTP